MSIYKQRHVCSYGPVSALIQVMYDWTQLTCISGSLRVWGHAAAGTPWLFAKLRLHVKGQPYLHHITYDGKPGEYLSYESMDMSVMLALDVQIQKVWHKCCDTLQNENVALLTVTVT